MSARTKIIAVVYTAIIAMFIVALFVSHRRHEREQEQARIEVARAEARADTTRTLYADSLSSVRAHLQMPVSATEMDSVVGALSDRIAGLVRDRGATVREVVRFVRTPVPVYVTGTAQADTTGRDLAVTPGAQPDTLAFHIEDRGPVADVDLDIWVSPSTEALRYVLLARLRPETFTTYTVDFQGPDGVRRREVWVEAPGFTERVDTYALAPEFVAAPPAPPAPSASNLSFDLELQANILPSFGGQAVVEVGFARSLAAQAGYAFVLGDELTHMPVAAIVFRPLDLIRGR